MAIIRGKKTMHASCSVHNRSKTQPSSNLQNACAKCRQSSRRKGGCSHLCKASFRCKLLNRNHPIFLHGPISPACPSVWEMLRIVRAHECVCASAQGSARKSERAHARESEKYMYIHIASICIYTHSVIQTYTSIQRKFGKLGRSTYTSRSLTSNTRAQ